MKFGKYIIDKMPNIIIYNFTIFIIISLLIAFESKIELIIAVIIILLVVEIIVITIDYLKKQCFYKSFKNNLDNLDKKYLILETINKPGFYEGEILYDSLYEIDKSMIENIKKQTINKQEFKEYIEMWIHEVKIPIASIVLLIHNNKNKVNGKILKEIKKIDSCTEQVLYYTREEFAEKDYLIKEYNLKKIINTVAINNKNDLLELNISLEVDKCNELVLTDSKWLEFILNQIINNSIKYIDKTKENNYIKISTKKEESKTLLIIEDDGIGIKSNEISRVFNKSFTGTNGRNNKKATGMGLYLVKKLSNKLGHKVEIEAKENEYTKVIITFNEGEYYNVLK